MKLSYSSRIAAAVESYLDNADWTYAFDRDKGRFIFWLNLQCRLTQACFTVRIRDDSYTVYAASPVNADPEDEDTFAVMCEYIHRVNYGLTSCCFELDCDDGEIRCRVHRNCAAAIPTSDEIGEAVTDAGHMLRRYADGILGILFEGDTASEAEEKSLSELYRMVRNAADDPEADPRLRDRLSLLSLLLNGTEGEDETDEQEQDDASEESECGADAGLDVTAYQEPEAGEEEEEPEDGFERLFLLEEEWNDEWKVAEDPDSCEDPEEIVFEFIMTGYPDDDGRIVRCPPEGEEIFGNNRKEAV